MTGHCDTKSPLGGGEEQRGERERGEKEGVEREGGRDTKRTQELGQEASEKQQELSQAKLWQGELVFL